MEIRYTLTPDDYAEGNRLLLLNSTFLRKLNFFLFVKLGQWLGIPIFGIAVVLFVLNLETPRWRLGPSVAGILGALAWLGFLGIIYPYTYKKRLTRYFKELKMSGERTLTADASGISITRVDGAAEGRFSWSVMDGGVESEAQFALFPNLRQFVPLPKRAMTLEQQSEFRALVAAHIAAFRGCKLEAWIPK